MSNIGFIIDSLNGGGAERVVLNLSKKIVELGHIVHIFILKNEIDYKFDKSLFATHVISDSGKVHPIRFFSKRKLAKLLRAQIDAQSIEFDLFVSHLEMSDEITKLAKLPNLHHCIHGVISKFVESKYKNTTGLKRLRRKYKYFLKMRNQYSNTKLITVSKGVADDLIKFGIKPKSYTTIYNLFDFDYIKEKANEEAISESDYIICVARFAKDKRHDVLIKAYKDANIREKLLLLGTTDKLSDEENLSCIKQMIIDLGIEDKVIFKGFIPNPYPWIQKAKALILSSDHEALPTVLIESLILKTQVVSTNCPTGPAEILDGELKEFLSPVGDVAALSSNIRKALKNPLHIESKYIEKFSADKIANQYIDLCKR